MERIKIVEGRNERRTDRPIDDGWMDGWRDNGWINKKMRLIHDEMTEGQIDR